MANSFAGCRIDKWSPNIYEIQDKYIHPIPYYRSVTILINKKTYQSYSFAKSTQIINKIDFVIH